MNDIKPIRLGVRFEPPTLLLVYKQMKTGKFRCRAMPIKNLEILSDVEVYTRKFCLNEKNKVYLQNVPQKRIEKIIFLI